MRFALLILLMCVCILPASAQMLGQGDLLPDPHCPFPSGIQTADFNRDGIVDYYILNTAFRSIQTPDINLYMSVSDTDRVKVSLLSTYFVLSISRRSCVADLNGDGYPEIIQFVLNPITTSTYLDAAIWYNNAGTFTSTPLSVQTGHTPAAFSSMSVHFAVPKDLDGDGDEEVVFGVSQFGMFNPVYTSVDVAVLDVAGGRPVISTSMGHLDGSAANLKFADMDNDGIDDIVRVLRSGDLIWARDIGQHRFTRTYSINNSFQLTDSQGVPEIAERAIPFDIDSDGDKDVFVFYETTGKVVQYEALSPGVFGPATVLPIPPLVGVDFAQFVDMDLDGTTELVVCGYNIGTQSYEYSAFVLDPYTMSVLDSRVIRSRAEFSPSLMQAPSDNPTIADLDTNGSPDILFTIYKDQPGSPSPVLPGYVANAFDACRFAPYGFANAGDHSIKLSSIGNPVSGNPYWRLRIEGMPSFAPYLLIMSPWQIGSHWFGNVHLYPNIDVLLPGFANASGQKEYHFAWAPPGMITYLQAFAADPSAFGGLLSSQGYEVEFAKKWK